MLRNGKASAEQSGGQPIQPEGSSARECSLRRQYQRQGLKEEGGLDTEMFEKERFREGSKNKEAA